MTAQSPSPVNPLSSQLKPKPPDPAFRSPRDPVSSCLSTRNPRLAPSPQEQPLCSQQALCVRCYHSGENVPVPTPLGGATGPGSARCCPTFAVPSAGPSLCPVKTHLSFKAQLKCPHCHPPNSEPPPPPTCENLESPLLSHSCCGVVAFVPTKQ